MTDADGRIMGSDEQGSVRGEIMENCTVSQSEHWMWCESNMAADKLKTLSASS